MVNEKLTQEEVDLISGESTKNRAQRRQAKFKRVTNLFTKKGYIPHLNAIRIVRKRNNKKHIKYVLLDRKGV